MPLIDCVADCIAATGDCSVDCIAASDDYSADCIAATADCIIITADCTADYTVDFIAKCAVHCVDFLVFPILLLLLLCFGHSRRC